MPTPLEVIRKGEEEFDKNQRLFLAGKYHSTQFNKWHKQTLKATLQALWDEAEGRKEVVEHSEDCIGEFCDGSVCDIAERQYGNKVIQTYQDSLLELIKAI